MEDLSLRDIWAIFKRRRWYFLLTFLLIFSVGMTVAFKWARYRASTTVQIEQPLISSNVATTSADNADMLAGLADRRISRIEQEVKSVPSLNAIIQKLDLYPSINKKLPPEKLAAIMRSKIHLHFINSTVSNPAAMQRESVERLSAIAFTVSFEYSDPELTKKALDEIVQAFIDYEANQRLSQTQETSSFLGEEIAALEKSIKEQEKKVAEFKAQFGESGPNATMFNQQASMSNMMTLQNVESQIATIAGTIGTLRSQLTTTEPYLPTVEADGKLLNAPSAQLKALQAQYAALGGRYGPEHPDVVKVREQMKALQAQLKDHGKANSVKRDADNPVYLQLSAQLSAAQAQQQALMAQRESLKIQQNKYDQMIAKNPQLEQQMSQLTLDLDNAKERYSLLKEKKLTAEMKEKLQSGKNSQFLKVINPATVPDQTHPKRLLLILGTLALALMSGLSMVIMVEALSQSVRGANHLAAIVGVAPLVTVPYIAIKPAGAAHG